MGAWGRERREDRRGRGDEWGKEVSTSILLRRDLDRGAREVREGRSTAAAVVVVVVVMFPVRCSGCYSCCWSGGVDDVGTVEMTGCELGGIWETLNRVLCYGWIVRERLSE